MGKNKRIAGLLGLTLVLMTSNVYAKEITKIVGSDKYDTSYKAANMVKSDTIIIANGDVFADALSSYNILNKKKCKLILIKNDDFKDLNKALNKDIKKVYIIGGYNTLSKDLESKVKELVNSNAIIERVSGENRYSTNEKTLKMGNYKEVGVADGRNYPDALASSGVLNYYDIGLLLVNGSKPYKTDYKVAYTFGGKHSVMQDNGRRLAGKDRYETADIINQATLFKESKPGNLIYTDGKDFTNVLTGLNLFSYNNLNKRMNNWIILTNNGDMSNFSRKYSHMIEDEHKFIIGDLNLSDIEHKEVVQPPSKLQHKDLYSALLAKYPNILEYSKDVNDLMKKDLKKTAMTHRINDIINNSKDIRIVDALKITGSGSPSVIFALTVDGKYYDIYMNPVPDRILRIQSVLTEHKNKLKAQGKLSKENSDFGNNIKDGKYNEEAYFILYSIDNNQFFNGVKSTYDIDYGSGETEAISKFDYDNPDKKYGKLTDYEKVVDVYKNGRLVTYYLIGDKVYSAKGHIAKTYRLLRDKKELPNYLGRINQVKDVYDAIN